MRLPRTLDAVEVRVIGSLLEKEQTTPDAYPLTLNALLAACNQRSNREPVMELDAGDVRNALDRLHEDVLVWPSSGARVERWRHNLDRRWQLEPAAKAVLTVMLLRGAQTPGELRTRTERMHAFAATEEVEDVLLGLAEGPEPMVAELERRPGQREARWIHLVGDVPEEAPVARPTPPTVDRPGLTDRVAALEERVAALEAALESLGGR